MKTQIQVYGNMDWFNAAEQPNSFSDLPPEFLQAYELWTRDSKANHDSMVKLLEPYVYAYFIPHSIRGSEELFECPSGDALEEIRAHKIRLVGVDFSISPIPLAKAEALFYVPVKSAFYQITDLESWQDENDLFVSGIVFGWDIPEVDCGSMGDHRGAECVLPYDGTF